MQGESSYLTDPVVEELVTGRQRLQRQHFATLLQSDSEGVGDRRTQELFQRPGLETLASQVGILRVAFQQALAFAVAADAQRQGLGKPG